MVNFGELSAPKAFGKVSLLELAPPLQPEALPFDLPVARYLEETLAGMNGAPPSGKDERESETSPSWRRLRKVLSSPPAREVCSALAWLVVGVTLELFYDEGLERFREILSSSWQNVMFSLGTKGRDWLLDALPTSFCQAIYRLMVDAFAPSAALLTKHPGKVLQKIGAIVHFELTGLQVAPKTLLDLRRKVYRSPILNQPFLDLLAARKAEARREKLEGHQSGAPLGFGSLEGSALEETQMEHILEKRFEEAEAAMRRPGGRTLPPLCPEELSADRHLHITDASDALYLKHLQRINPEAAKAELEAIARAREAMLEPASPQAGSSSPAATSSKGDLLVPPSTTAHRMASSSRSFHKTGQPHESAAERKRQEEMLAAKIEAPLPEAYLLKPLDTSGVSPVVDRLVPGRPGKPEALTLNIRKPVEKFMPNKPSAPSSSSSSPAAAGGLPPLSGSSSTSSPFSSCGEFDAPTRPMRRERGSTNGFAMRSMRSGTKTMTKLPELMEAVSPQMKKEIRLKRMEDDLAGFHKRAFEQYKKEYDLVTGHKRSWLDAERLQQEETSTLQRHEALLGSRSAPALRLFGARGPAGEMADRRQDGGAGNAARRPAPAAARQGGGGGRPSVVSRSPSFGGAGGDGGPRWNQLTSAN